MVIFCCDFKESKLALKVIEQYPITVFEVNENSLLQNKTLKLLSFNFYF